MNKLRINILTPIPFWHVGTTELINKLRENSFIIVALDIWDFKYYDEQGNIQNLVPKLFKGIFKKIYLRLFRKHIIRKYINNNDIVDIQWCGHYYSKYIDCIKKRKVKIIATLFGSDFYRSSVKEKKIQSKIFEKADNIVMGINMLTDFEKYFPNLNHKIKFNQYGSVRIDKIIEINTPSNKKIFRDKYNIAKNKIVITIGYNSKPEQQHLRFLEQIIKLPKNIKDKLLLIFPLTYGEQKDSIYINELKNKVIILNIDSLYFENRLTDEEIAETKIISDITINLQTTDALASSIKEAFAAENILIVGKWLPYSIYEDIGLFFKRSEIDEFYNVFLDVLNNLDYYKSQCFKNPEITSKFASWKNIIPQFINIYSQV